MSFRLPSKTNRVWLIASLFCFLFIFGMGSLYAQQTTQIEIDNADTFEGDESLGKNVSRLIGNVRFRHQGAIMYCDSAYLYQETNSLDAFGKIRIVQGDSLQLTGDFLKYDGNTRQAVVTGNVLLSDRDLLLRTPSLYYNLGTDVADYVNGGVITSKNNKLVSKRGYYYSKERMVYFRDSVRLDNPRYFILADTLKYSTATRTAFFEGPTRLHSTGSDSTVITCRKGQYNTVSEKSVFTERALVQSKENGLTGDSLVFNNISRVGTAFGNVVVTDTLQKLLITGDYAFSDDRSKYALVTGKAMLTRVFENDSLFLHADTLIARQDTVSLHKSWSAFYGVRIFKTDLQGKCDSLTYSSADSTLSFHSAPVLWSEENQLTALFMNMQLAGSRITELRLFDDAFITSMEDSVRFNQIKGRNMTGYFTDNKLTSIKVEGNGQSVYYTRNSKDQFTGVNRADCSDMLIQIEESKIKSITLINDPDATLYPVNELQPDELRLKGFEWLGSLRPADKQDIFRR